MVNAGKYNRKITIVSVQHGKDAQGFPVDTETIVLQPYAEVKTTKGYTIIINNSDFEKALTRFTIRYPQRTTIDREMLVKYNGKTYEIQYLNNIDEKNEELEIQAKEVTH